jgi:hypothetical protein
LTLRPAVFFGIGSAQAAPVAEPEAAQGRRNAGAAQPQRIIAADASLTDARVLPVLGVGGGDARPVPGFEVLN